MLKNQGSGFLETKRKSTPTNPYKAEENLISLANPKIVFSLNTPIIWNQLNYKIELLAWYIAGTSQIPIKRCVRLSTDSQTDYDEEDYDDDDDDDDDSCFILDAKHYGSISRFYNHSCKPNVHIQNVIIINGFFLYKYSNVFAFYF